MVAETVFDEWDLYEHPRYMQNRYPANVPLRVRRESAMYFFRQKTDAFHGTRYGEVVLSAADGSIQYLPRFLRWDGVRAVRFAMRKSNPNAVAVFSVSPDRSSRHTFIEGKTPSWPMHRDTAWHQITVPLALTPASPRMESHQPATQKELMYEAVANIGQGQPIIDAFALPADTIFQLVFGLRNGRSGDTLHFDRVEFLRDKPPAPEVAGRVDPRQAGVHIHIATRHGSTVLQTDSDGTFRYAPPADATVIDVRAEVDRRWYAPTAGRYIELGEYVPPLEIPLHPDTGANIARGATTKFRYEYTKDRGTIYEPLQTFSFGFENTAIEVASNQFGYLDRDRRFENPDDAFRLALIGECYFEAQHVSPAEAAWNIAEAKVRLHTDTPAEVISPVQSHNLLISGWLPLQSHILRYKPDVVMITFVSPDSFSWLLPEYAAAFYYAAPGHLPVYLFDLDPKTGELIPLPQDPNWNAYRMDYSYTPEQRDALAKKYYHSAFWCGDPEHPPKWAARMERILIAGFRQIVAASKAQGARVVLGYFSTMGTVSTATSTAADGTTCDPTRVFTLMQHIARESGMEFFDGTKYMREYTVRDENGSSIVAWPHVGHWSPAGHYFAGEAIGDYVLNALSHEENGAAENSTDRP